MTNTQRWIWTLALGLLGGITQAATDSGAKPVDYLRHGLVNLGPAIVALKMTLDQQPKDIGPKQ